MYNIQCRAGLWMGCWRFIYYSVASRVERNCKNLATQKHNASATANMKNNVIQFIEVLRL